MNSTSSLLRWRCTGMAAPGAKLSVPMAKADPVRRGSTLMTTSPVAGGPSLRISSILRVFYTTTNGITTLLPIVLDLQRDAEVFRFERLDDRLQIVELPAGHADRIPVNARLNFQT